MPISQTVYINIVVKGGSVELAELKAPLKDVQAGATAAGNAIRDNIYKPLRESTTQASDLTNALMGIYGRATQSATANLSMLQSTARAISDNLVPALRQAETAYAGMYSQGSAAAKSNLATLESTARAINGELVPAIRSAESAYAGLYSKAQAITSMNMATLQNATRIAGIAAAPSGSITGDRGIYGGASREDISVAQANLATYQATAAVLNDRYVPALQNAATANAGIYSVMPKVETAAKANLATYETTARQLSNSLIPALRSTGAAAYDQGVLMNTSAKATDAALAPSVWNARFRTITDGLNNVNKSWWKADDSVMRMIFTMQKALASMLIITTAWAALVTIPEMIIKGIISGFAAMIKAAAEFEQQMISLSAVLASTQQFDVDPVKNFRLAGEAAQAMMMELLKRGNEINGSIAESTRLLQTMIAGGVGAYVKNAKEAVDLTILLVNSIGGVTMGQDRMRQLTSEVRQLLQGTLAPTATLATLLFKNKEEMRQFFDHAAKGKTLTEDLTKKLQGFVQAVQPLSVTFQGFLTSAQDIGTIISNWAFKHVFDVARVSLKQWRDDFFKNIDEMQVASATLGASFMVTMENAFDLAGVTQKSFLNLFDTISRTGAEMTAKLVFAITVLSNIGTLTTSLWNITVGIIKMIADIPMMLFKLVENTVRYIYNILVELINKVRTLLGQEPLVKVQFADMSQFMKDLDQAAKGLLDLRNLEDPNLKSDLTRQRVLDETQVIVARISKEMKIQKDLKDILLKGERQEKEDKAAQALLHKAIIEMTRMELEYAKLRVANDPRKVLELEHKARLAVLNEEYKKNAKILEDILGIENAIYGVRVKNLDIASIIAVGNAWKEVHKNIAETNTELDAMLRSAKVTATRAGGIMEREETVEEVINKLYNSMITKAMAAGIPVQELVKHFKEFNDITELMRKNAVAKEWAARWRAAFGDYLRSIESVINQSEILITQTQELFIAFESSSQGLRNYIAHIRNIIGSYQDLVAYQEKIKSAMADLDYKMTEGVDFYSPEELAKMEEYYRRLEGALKRTQQAAANNINELKQIIAPFANAFAQFFEGIVSGTETLSSAFKKMIGQMISHIGDLVIACGIGIMAEGFLGNPAKIAIGLMYIALGGALKGLGALIGGAGGNRGNVGAPNNTASSAPKPVYVDQHGIAVQQGMQHALMQNTIAINNLNSEVSRLSKENGDTLVTNAIRNNPNAVLKPLSNKIGNSFEAQRIFGGAVLGQNA